MDDLLLVPRPPLSVSYMLVNPTKLFMCARIVQSFLRATSGETNTAVSRVFGAFSVSFRCCALVFDAHSLDQHQVIIRSSPGSRAALVFIAVVFLVACFARHDMICVQSREPPVLRASFVRLLGTRSVHL